MFEEDYEDYECYDSEEYGTNYGRYAGTYAQDVMGYSDDVIDDAFEGDPDAYWNIDQLFFRNQLPAAISLNLFICRDL